MRRDTKEQVVNDVGAFVKDASVIVRTDFTGVTVEDMTKLRRAIRKAKGSYRVIKNTLARISFSEPGMDVFTRKFEGPSGFAFGFDADAAIGVCKALKAFEKDNAKFKISGGWLEGREVSVDEIRAFADLPGRTVLIGQLLGVLTSPMRNLVTVLSAPIRNVAVALKAVAEKRESAGGQ